MDSKMKLAMTLTAMSFVLTACPSSNQVTPGGQICADGYDPVSPKKPQPGLKPTPMDPTENKSAPVDVRLKPGIYTYSYGAVVYFEKKKDNPLKIQFHDSAASGISTKQGIYCSANLSKTSNIPLNETEAVTDIIVCPDDLHQVVRSRKFKYSVANGRINFDRPEVNYTQEGYCGDSAQKVHGKDEAVFLKLDEGRFEIRSTKDMGSAYHDLEVRMTYAPFAPGTMHADCTKCVPPPNPVQPKSNPQPIKKEAQDPQRGRR